MEDRPQSFDSREDAEAFCRERQREDAAGTWIPWQRDDGRWIALRTNLPHTQPSGSHSESKPRPPEPDDPRSGGARDVPGYF
jgi:hypothetical protein